MAAKDTAVSLPLSVISRVDVGRLEREIAAIDEFLRQSKLRKTGTPMQLPRTSRTLEETVAINKLNLLQASDRQTLLASLKDIKQHAPFVQISFASDPSAAFIQKITAWFRQEIHPIVLIQVGLQPGIAAGCTVRTANKYYDFSLRQYLDRQRPLLIEKIGSGV